MTTDAMLDDWILLAVRDCGGAATIVDIAKHIWTHHEAELRSSEEMFFTWQYRMRWAGQRLQNQGKIRKTKDGSRARWLLLRTSIGPA